MRVIIDNNQVRHFSPSECMDVLGSKFEGITLAPYVYAEILLRPDCARSLVWLQEFDVLFGMEDLKLLETIAPLSRIHLEQFQPFEPPDSPIYKRLGSGLWEPKDHLIKWARETKQRHRHFTAEMGEAAKQILMKVKDIRKERPEFKSKYRDLCEALLDAGNGPESFLGSIVTGFITNWGDRIPACSDHQVLFDAAIENQYLRRFFRGQFYYALCITHAWKGPAGKHNFDPKPRHDDATDLSLLLYSGDGDRIVTEDRMLRRAVPWIEPSGAISTTKIS